jgi:hypothetical protein
MLLYWCPFFRGKITISMVNQDRLFTNRIKPKVKLPRWVKRKLVVQECWECFWQLIASPLALISVLACLWYRFPTGVLAWSLCVGPLKHLFDIPLCIVAASVVMRLALGLPSIERPSVTHMLGMVAALPLQMGVAYSPCMAALVKLWKGIVKGENVSRSKTER